MKTMKRALAMIMAAFIIVGVFAPVSPQAATKPTVSFYGWAKKDQSQCYLKVKNGGSDGYYYRIYVNGKLYKANGKSVLEPGLRQYCKVCGIPKNTIITVSVKGVKQTVWSPRIVIAPVMLEGTHFKFSYVSDTAKIVKFSWKKITGATDYAVYLSTSPSKGWTKVGSTKGTSIKISKFKGKSFDYGTRYYYKVVCRKKVNGKYYGSKIPSDFDDYGSFSFKAKYIQ